jgi:hypothetical protein
MTTTDCTPATCSDMDDEAAERVEFYRCQLLACYEATHTEATLAGRQKAEQDAAAWLAEADLLGIDLYPVAGELQELARQQVLAADARRTGLTVSELTKLALGHTVRVNLNTASATRKDKLVQSRTRFVVELEDGPRVGTLHYTDRWGMVVRFEDDAWTPAGPFVTVAR